MASVKFQSVANNHRYYLNELNSVWTAAKVRQVASPPFNWVTADEAEGIIATGGEITSAWYNWQHEQDPAVLGQNMVPTPDEVPTSP